MGMYTSYDLVVMEDTPQMSAVSLIEELREDCEDALYALDERGNTEEDMKWYSHHRDLLKFSKKHPLALFCLSGEGEETGDAWRAYYQNGRIQVCRASLTYPEFNRDSLVHVPLVD